MSACISGGTELPFQPQSYAMQRGGGPKVNETFRSEIPFSRTPINKRCFKFKVLTATHVNT